MARQKRKKMILLRQREPPTREEAELKKREIERELAELGVGKNRLFKIDILIRNLNVINRYLKELKK